MKEKPEDKEAKYTYRFSIATNGSPMGPVANFRLSERVKYWSGVIHHSLKECVALKPNSDMGLCQLVRLLYRYGTLPQGMGATATSPGAGELPPDETFSRFFAERATAIGDDAELRRRFQVAETKLRIILEETAAHPRSFDPSFSPLAGEILKQGLLSYKYWLDEQPRALDNDRLNKVKKDLGYGDDEIDHEMEFWSENHYIMFASSEYLLGQLWQDETFQPCRLFVDAGDTTGAKTGVAATRPRPGPGIEVAQQPADVRLDGVQLLRLLPGAPLGAAQSRRLRARRGGAHQSHDGRRPDALRRHPLPAPRRDGRRRRAQPVQVQEPRVRQRADGRRRDHARRQRCLH